MDNEPLRHALLQAKALGLKNLDDIIRHRADYSYSFRKDYLTWNITFHLGNQQRRGLMRFAELLRLHTPGPVFEPRFVK
jgi:hypothetical protein